MLTFPIGKAKPQETSLQALKTELGEELGIKIIQAKELFSYEKDYNFDGKKIHIKTHVFDVLKYTGKIQNKEPKKHRWIKFMTLDEVKKSGRTVADCVLQYIKRNKV